MIVCLSFLSLVLLLAMPGRGDLILVDGGKSPYVIHHVAEAPASVKAAAKELQRVVALATGVNLPIESAPAPGRPSIVLGDGPMARGAGISGEALAYEHYRIQTRGEHLFIVGRDTADDQATPWSGVSRGTQFGVFTFLETAVGVRWIMPGDIGEEIPRHTTLAVPALNLLEGPAFVGRVVDIPDGISLPWALRHKVDATNSYDASNSAFIVHTGHSWDRFMPSSLRDDHPEWDAIGGDKQKFCTQHPEAMQAFSANVIAWLAAEPDKHMVNVSPSDGQGYCRCERCQRLMERDPHDRDSFTEAVLKSYNDVARVVAAQQPGRMVGGYAYGATTYPPKRPVALDANVFIELAPLNYYGMGLYKPSYFAEFEPLLAAWRALTPNIGYHNYCHWHRSQSGAPYGPALDILRMQFPVLAKLGYKTVREVGTPNWAYGGLNNYLLAKLLWNPQLDVSATCAEWLGLAYGPGASSMAEIYRLLDEGFRTFKTQKESFDYHGDNYEIMADKIEAIYLPRLQRVDALLQEALAVQTQQRPRQRLEMFVANWIVFQYHLREAGWLKDAQASPFYRSDDDFKEFLANGTGTSLQPAQSPQWFWFWRGLRAQKPMPPRPPVNASTFRGERRRATIPRLPQATSVTLDGRIDEAAWRHAITLTEFRQPGNAGPAQADTRVQVIHDGHTLFVAFDCDDDAIDRIEHPVYAENSSRVFDSNAVELFINLSDRAERYWHFAVTPSNSRWSGIRNIANAVPWSSSAQRRRGGWSAELAIPFSSLDAELGALPPARVNLARSRRHGEQRENSSWNLVERGFMEPANFGQWIFDSP